ncbi:2-oxoglutarate dehydrogenase E1 component [Buchnera aphidicola (Mindarus keteleerifoliae)]|uniref:2-oxoglutarate dehydrogenase E1 component n=1 Tax=Buchnera aphidicola TaxID=9 RepID=UPI0031B6D068
MNDGHEKYWGNFLNIINSNQFYIQYLYKKFLKNSNSIDNCWEKVFLQFSKKIKNKNKIFNNKILKKIKLLNKRDNFKDNCSFRIIKLINLFRKYGHHYANLDPLEKNKRKFHIDMKLSTYNKKENKFIQDENFFYLNNKKKYSSLENLYSDLKKIYSDSMGIEYMHVENIKEKKWIQKNVESLVQNSLCNEYEQKEILKNLISAESLEKYLNIKFPGVKRFSLEGSETLIPMLSNIISQTIKSKVSKILLGMAHRGRINVLANIIGKKIRNIFYEFSSKIKNNFYSGDVKYHMGFKSILKKTNNILIDLKFNPSHLEIVSPVVLGSVRAHLDQQKEFNTNNVLPLIIHGDASITGQGVVQETLNMSQTRGYTVGGSIHIIINNQIGFTTSDQADLRSTKYCTDIAKMIQAPIFHVNADNPEEAVFLSKLALKYRNIFKKDIFIDLVCYRRFGHNEIDDPSATQPMMYQKIKNHKTVKTLYEEKLINSKLITSNDVSKIYLDYKKKLDIEYEKYLCLKSKKKFLFLLKKNENFDLKNNEKKNSVKNIKNIAKNIFSLPTSINLHKKVQNIYQERLKMANEKTNFDWGSSELLAYGILLNQNISCRITGEDVSRGTFFHRHAMIHDQKNGQVYTPLKVFCKFKKSKFYIWDSVLSEESTLAFEYGYSSTNQNMLVVWEAQFGDFSNGAQIVIDQFLSSSEQKWDETSGLVMLLPHGYEGQGPEHSSARIERFLQLCAQKNMQISVPTTSGQLHHLLVEHAFKKNKKPLIIISPKSLLRNPLTFSSLQELKYGKFQSVIYDIKKIKEKKINKIIFCCGKIYYELLSNQIKYQKNNIFIIRIENLYPFPIKEIMKIFQSFNKINDIIWCQEEPKNQGAWSYIKNYFEKKIFKNTKIIYIGRKKLAAPAGGSFYLHQKEQKKIISDALNII